MEQSENYIVLLFLHQIIPWLLRLSTWLQLQWAHVWSLNTYLYKYISLKYINNHRTLTSNIHRYNLPWPGPEHQEKLRGCYHTFCLDIYAQQQLKVYWKHVKLRLFRSIPQEHQYQWHLKKWQWEKILSVIIYRSELDILFSSNHNIHKSSSGLCFWASDLLIERFL